MVKEIYDDLINDMTWSYSRLRCFENCKYQWYSKYICGDKEAPMFYSSYGSYIHELIESHYNDNVSKEELLSRFLTNYRDKVEGEIPSPSIGQKYIEKGIKYFNNFQDFPFNPVATEEKVNFKINNYNFVGIIDYLGEKDGEYYIIDNKSRDLKPRSKRKKPTLSDKELDDMLVQLYLYSIPVHDRYGKYPKALCFNCFKEGIFIQEDFNQKDFNKAVDWALNVIDQIKDMTDKNFNPNIDYFKCKYLCGLNSECIYWQMS